MRNLLRKLNIFKFFLQSIKGETALWKSFWILYVLFGIIQLLLLEYFFNSYIAGSYITFDVHNYMMDKFITFAFPYLAFSSICVWACGKNSWIEWNLLSKCIIIIPVIFASFHLINIF